MRNFVREYKQIIEYQCIDSLTLFLQFSYTLTKCDANIFLIKMTGGSLTNWHVNVNKLKNVCSITLEKLSLKL